MDYNKFTKTVNKHIFGETTLDLLKNLANNPERFVGLFRPSKPRTKIIQHILQSREIKFGDAMEEIISEYLNENGYIIKENKKIGKGLEVDQYFEDIKGIVYIIEQKMRDDHDSTKRVGQFNNFREKVKLLYSKYEKNLVAYMYFMDPTMRKNENYYLDEITKLINEYKLKEIGLMYGKVFFERFLSTKQWYELLDLLKTWKEKLQELPDLNLENDENLTEILSTETGIRLINKLAGNETLWKEGIIKILFPSKEIWSQLIKNMKKKYETHSKHNLLELKDLSPDYTLVNVLNNMIKKYY
jgi:hypothetical protein